jgi:hypothetical protein
MKKRAYLILAACLASALFAGPLFAQTTGGNGSDDKGKQTNSPAYGDNGGAENGESGEGEAPDNGKTPGKGTAKKPVEKGPSRISTQWQVVNNLDYRPGDQNFTISIGLMIPLAIMYKGDNILEKKITLGGAGSFQYDYFFNRWFFAGGILGGAFSDTISKNFLFQIIWGAQAGTIIPLWRFEFPITLSLGGITESYLDSNCVSFFMRPSAGISFRATESWSFGASCNYYWIPQRGTKRPGFQNGEFDTDAHFIEVSATASYHF